jgi:hypothetical protein
MATPDRFVFRLDQIAKDLSDIDTAIAAGLSTCQDLRFGFVPLETPMESPRSIVKNKRQRRGREVY